MKMKEKIIYYSFFILCGLFSLLEIILMKLTYLKNVEVSIELITIIFFSSWILSIQILILLGELGDKNDN